MVAEKGHPEDLEVLVEMAKPEELEMLEVLHHLKEITEEPVTQEHKVVVAAEQLKLEVQLVIMEVMVVMEQ